jgi:tetratricopeptide (TPR) repeat protein
MKDLLSGKVPLFGTPEKALKKILQERERGDLSRARKTAVESLEKWPDDYNLAIEAAQACLDLSDYPQAANIFKNAHKRHADHRAEILEFALAAFRQSFSTLLGGFIVEAFLKGRNLEGIADLLRASPESFVNDLIKRGETKSKNIAGSDESRSTLLAENELLLGILYREAKQFEKAVESLGRALEMLSGDAQAIGELLVQIEQELPAHALVKFYLGLASLMLAHPDKAEARFFQCLELEGPPLDKIRSALETAKEPCPNGELIKGEILIRSLDLAAGAALIRAYVWNEPPEAEAGGNSAAREERMRVVETRLAGLPDSAFASADVAFLYCDAAAGLGLVKNAIDVLERLAAGSPEQARAIIDWLERNEAGSPTAPGQHLLARVYIQSGIWDRGVRAAQRAVELNATLVTNLIEMLRRTIDETPDSDPSLRALLAVLYARSGDRTSAEEVYGALKRARALGDTELVDLSGEIMRHSGVFLTGVVSAIEISLESGKIADAIPSVTALYREKPEEHENLASSIRELAEEHDGYWPAAAQLADHLAKEEAQLSEPFRFLQAAAHLFTGEVERAIFEFDQLLMRNPDLKYRLIEIYKKALERFESNATLHLALYHLYIEEELLADAAHHLCRTLELDPNQIRDVVARFGKLVEKEPGNLGIWEEMLKTALAMNRTSLAKEVLARAVSALPREKAAALHVYGAKISAADGKWDDALQCIALTLTSAEADVRAIEAEIRSIIARDPGNPQAQLLLGEALLRLGRDGEAVSAIRRCLELAPALRQDVKEKLEKFLPLSIEPWLLSAVLGELAWLEGLRDEAFRRFAAAQKGPRETLAGLSASLERIRARDAEDEHLELLYARTLSLEGRHEETVAILEPLIAKNASLTRAATDILISIVTDRPGQIDANRLLSRIFVRSGDIEQSRLAVLRMLSEETADAAILDGVVSEFLALHEGDAEFLVHFAGLKARRGEMKEALARFRTALLIDASRSEAILAALGKHVWPQELGETERLLRLDCLMASHRNDEAFALLGTLPAQDRAAATEVVNRLTLLIAEAPRREYYALGASLLARTGQLEEAERFILDGCAALGTDDALDLRIELAEILHNSGSVERAARLFAEALDASTAKGAVLKRIERSYTRWADREIESISARFETGNASDEEIASLARLVLERRGPEKALDVVCRSSVARELRSELLGSIYLSMDRPTLACAALDATGDDECSSDSARSAHRYRAGLAHERIADYARAAALFAAAAGEGVRRDDSGARALRNYGRLLESRCEERALVLEKTDVI